MVRTTKQRLIDTIKYLDELTGIIINSKQSQRRTIDAFVTRCIQEFIHCSTTPKRRNKLYHASAYLTKLYCPNVAHWRRVECIKEAQRLIGEALC